MRTIRSFIAIPLAPPIEHSLVRLIQNVQEEGDGIRWVPTDDLHLTLKFLGEIENVEVPAVCEAIRDVCDQIEPFELIFGGAKGMPSSDRARVLCMGVQDPTGGLCQLVSGLETRLADLRFKPESRDYRPHFALGRARSGYRKAEDDVMKRLMEYSDVVLGEMTADEVLLVGSFLEKSGPSYQVMDTIELG